MNIHAGRDLGLTAPPLPASAGEELHAFASRLYPICRSLTGEGVRQTLGMISQAVPLSLDRDCHRHGCVRLGNST